MGKTLIPAPPPPRPPWEPWEPWDEEDEKNNAQHRPPFPIRTLVILTGIVALIIYGLFLFTF